MGHNKASNLVLLISLLSCNCRKTDNAEIPLPVRNRESRERLKENSDSNKENSVDEQSVDHLVQKGYDRLRVVDALRVARNNLRMAEDILETFVRN